MNKTYKVLITIGIVFLIIIMSLAGKIVFEIVKDAEEQSQRCSVRFLADGKEVGLYYLNKGDLIEEPTPPEKEGFEFSHWATHEHSVDGSEVFNFDTPITHHIALFAHYNRIPIEREPSKKTKENYDKIKNGMTKDKVVEILGEPDSISENEIQGYGKTEMYNYNIATLTGCQIYFHNGKVNMKNWTEL